MTSLKEAIRNWLGIEPCQCESCHCNRRLDSLEVWRRMTDRYLLDLEGVDPGDGEVISMKLRRVRNLRLREEDRVRADRAVHGPRSWERK